MKIGYISFNGIINTINTNQLLGATQNLISQGIDHLYYLFSTQGGIVNDGVRLYNSIKSLPVETTMHNMGNVNSIGNAIFLGATHRKACRHSTFMFHGVGFDSVSKRLEQKDLEGLLDGLLADQNIIGGIIADETSLSADDIKGLFVKSVTKDAAFALNCDIIGEIGMPTIDKAAPHLHLMIS